MENICKFNLNQTSDLMCTNFIYESTDCRRKPRKADSNILHIVIKGSGIFRCENISYTLEAGTLFAVCTGESYCIESIDGLEYSYISFCGRRSAEYVERLHLKAENRVFPDNNELIDFWTANLDFVTAENIDMVSEAVLLYSLARLSPVKKTTNTVVATILQYMGENYTNAGLSLETVSQHAGYNEKYISALFKKQCGVSYTQYLRDLRLKHAIFLMEQGVASVKNVALLSGFKDSLYFSKVFTQIMGMPPKQYIADIQKR